MKKYLFTTLVMAIFVIGFTASTEEESSKEQPSQTKETKEMVDEKKENTPKKKSVPKLSPKEQAVADAGYEKGTMFGMAASSDEQYSNMLDLVEGADGMEDEINKMWSEEAGRQYDIEYNTPTTPEEEKLKKIYIENFMKAMNGTMDAMDALENLGGKRR